MEYSLVPLTAGQQRDVVALFNHYVREGYAAFAEEEYPLEAYSAMLEKARGYPAVWARNAQGRFSGFGLLKPYHSSSAFRGCAELTIFLHPDCTGKGLGRTVLTHLEQEARPQGVRWLLAAISGPNRISRRFHAQNGFVECGCFKEIGTKWQTPFDLVWMQKRIDQ